MTIFDLEIQLVAVITAVACALPGVYLVLRQLSMMSDAISHTVLLGIVLGFFIVEDLSSPILVIGAAAVGVLTVGLVSVLERTRLVKEDASIGLVFPALFSIAVILISRYAGNVHLDSDVVLAGEIAYTSFDRLVWMGMDIGPRGLYVMGAILLVNLAFIWLFYKELKLTTFDAGLAAALGFAPVVLHYTLMSLVSVTVVGAFEIVGSVLVVALMIAPPAAAYLLTDRLSRMLAISAILGAATAISGYWLAFWLDASISGAMAAMAGVIFLLVFLFSPERGLIAARRRRAEQRWTFAQTMLVIHLLNHEGTPEADIESEYRHLQDFLRWKPEFAAQVLRRAIDGRLVLRTNGHLELTNSGRERARVAMAQ